MERYVLPDGWAWTTIGEVCQVNPTMSWPDGFTEDTPISFVPMAAVDEESGAITKGDQRPIGEVWKGHKRFQEGDVIFARITPCMENGKAALAMGLEHGIGVGSTEFHVLRSTDAISAEYLYHFARQQSFREEAAASMTGTAGQLRVPASFMTDASIPLPPLAEQRRIVAKLDALLSHARHSRAALDRLPTLLKQARQAILAAAFRGDLTERDPTDEPADALLARIRAERRARWEADLRARGKDPAQHVYPEPAAPDTADLAELPEGWAWTNVDTIISLLQYGTSVKADSDVDRGVPVLRMGNIQEGALDLTDLKYIDPTSEDIGKYQLVAGDILINRTNSPELVGKAGLFDHKGTFLFASYLIRLRVSAGQVVPRYLAMCINSQVGRQHVARVKHQVAGQANINSHDIRQMPVPLAPFCEQHRIVDKIVSLQAQADAIEAAARLARRRLDLVEQALLARAFRGELVPQDPADEPAGAMLARLREAREAESDERKTETRTPRAKGRVPRKKRGQPADTTTAVQGRLGM